MKKNVIDQSRRRLLTSVVLGAAVLPLVRATSDEAHAADLPLVTLDDPVAKALKYATDASKAPDAKPGSKCVNCKLYQGAANSTQGPCLLFPGKAVVAGGWCASWTAKT